MLPIMVDATAGPVGLAGAGESFERRRAWLEAAGVEPVRVTAPEEISGLRLLFIAGGDEAAAAALAREARSRGVLVNVEDRPALCDFHVPALVRRGDLVLAISTAGRAPAIAKLLREWLDARFGPEWSRYLDRAGEARVAWRAQGIPSAELASRTRKLAAEEGWLA